MSYEFQPPAISAATAEGQLRQLRSYLVKQAAQLNWAFGKLRSGRSPEEGGTEPDVYRLVRTRLRRERQRMHADVALDVGASVEAPAWLAGCTVVLAVAGDIPILCARYGETLRGENFAAQLRDGTLTLTQAPGQVTCLQGVA